jgi:hypothetical protein
MAESRGGGSSGVGRRSPRLFQIRENFEGSHHGR